MLTADTYGRPIVRGPVQSYVIGNPGELGDITDIDGHIRWLRRTGEDARCPGDVDALLDARLVLMAEEIAA